MPGRIPRPKFRYPPVRSESDLLQVLRTIHHDQYEQVFLSLFDYIRKLRSIKGMKESERIMKKTKHYHYRERIKLAATFLQSAGYLSYSSVLWEEYGLMFERHGLRAATSAQIGCIVKAYVTYMHRRAVAIADIAFEELLSRDPSAFDKSGVLSSVCKVSPHLIFHLASSKDVLTLNTLFKIHSTLFGSKSPYESSFVDLITNEILHRGWGESLDVGMISKISNHNQSHIDMLIKTAIEEQAIRVTRNLIKNERLDESKKKSVSEVHNTDTFHHLLRQILTTKNNVVVSDIEMLVPPPQNPQELTTVLYQFTRLSMTAKLQSSFDVCIENLLSSKTEDLSALSTIMICIPHGHYLGGRLRSYFESLSKTFGYQTVTNEGLFTICRLLEYLNPHIESILREELCCRGLDNMTSRELALFQRSLGIDVIPTVLEKRLYDQKLRDLLNLARIPQIQNHKKLSVEIADELAKRDWSRLTPLQFSSLCSAIVKMRASGRILNKVVFTHRSLAMPAPLFASVTESLKKLSLA